MEPVFVPTGKTLDRELGRLVAEDDADDPAALFRARDDAAREDAADALDAQILAGLVFP